LKSLSKQRWVYCYNWHLTTTQMTFLSWSKVGTYLQNYFQMSIHFHCFITDFNCSITTRQWMIVFTFHQKLRTHEYCFFVQFATSPQLWKL